MRSVGLAHKVAAFTVVHSEHSALSGVGTDDKIGRKSIDATYTNNTAQMVRFAVGRSN